MINEKIEKALLNLEKHGFETKYFSDREGALAWLLLQLESGKTAASGGSITLDELGLIERIQEKGVTYLDRTDPPEGKTRKEVERMAFSADYYFASANAVTEDGYILNVDGNGNRVAAINFGPDHVYLIVGHNKICKDAEAAYRRNHDIAAPLNCRRLNSETPCNQTGVCADCDSKRRICRVYALMKRAPYSHKITVVIIGENLGY